MSDKVSTINEKDMYEKKILRFLDSWRELALLTKSVLIWEKPSYPWAILAVVTVLFLKIAYLEPTFLTGICLGGMAITLFDYLAPLVSNSLWKQEEWTASKQRDLEAISSSLASVVTFFIYLWHTVSNTKHSKPSMYYTTNILSLLVLAWVGSTVNNLFITYILVLGVLMFPGLSHHGLIDKYYQTGALCFSQLLRSIHSPKPKSH